MRLRGKHREGDQRHSQTAAREIGAAIEKFATPGVVTIEALSKEPYKVPANRQIKTPVYIAATASR